MSKQNKRMLKVRNFIKNTQSKLYDIHQRKGALRSPSKSKMGISAKIVKDLESLTVFAKSSISEVWLGS